MALNRLERPKDWSTVVGQEYVVKNLSEQSKRREFFQAYVFAGQFGTGKTTMARILSRAVNCDHVDENGNPCGVCPACKSILNQQAEDVLEIDAASNTGVDSIRALKETVSYLPAGLKKRVIVIDEVHRLSGNAFDALLKVIEEPPEHVIFVLCTTDVRAIPSTILSRCARYTFGQIPQEQIKNRLREVADKYQMSATDEGLYLIAKNASGSMRNALNIMEQVSKSGVVSEEAVAQILGITDTESLTSLFGSILSGDILSCVRLIKAMEASGKDLFMAANDLMDICTDFMEASVSGISVLRGTEAYRASIESLLKSQKLEDILLVMSGIMEVRNSLQANPLVSTFIAGIIKISQTGNSAMVQLGKRVAELEEKVAAGFPVRTEAVDTVSVLPVEEKPGLDAELLEDGFVGVGDTEVPFAQEDGQSEVSETEAEACVEPSAPEESSDVTVSEEEPKSSPASVEQSVDNVWELLGFFEPSPTTSTQSVRAEEATVSEPLPDAGVSAEENSEEAGFETGVSGFMDIGAFPEFSDSFYGGLGEVASAQTDSYDVMDPEPVEEPIPVSGAGNAAEFESLLKEAKGILAFIYESQPILETAIELGCEAAYDDGLVFRTKYKDVYRIIQAYRDAGHLDKASFKLEMI